MIDQRSGPLRGITIVDLSMWWAGPLATQLFALYGATVIKVESVQRVDGWRLAGRANPAWGVEGSQTFNGVNLNKLGITLDLQDPRGKAILQDLVAGADALVENYSPRVMTNLRLTDDVLFGWKKDLVVLSMPGFGLEGPWRDFVGFAPTIEQVSGLPELVGYEDGPPSLGGNSIADPVGGFTGCMALLAALHERERTGAGQHIDLSQLESLTGLLGYALLGTQFEGAPPARVGNGSIHGAPRGAYPCLGEDRWVVISVRTDAEFAALCEVMTRPDLAVDDRFSTVEGRLQQRAALDQLVGEWTRLREPQEAAALLQARGVAAGPVLGPGGLLTDPHLRERGYFAELDRPVVGRHPHPGLPFQFSASPGVVTRAAPTLGQDNHAVLVEMLGMSEEQYRDLEAANVIGSQPLD